MIRNWPTQSRPREKLINDGVHSLSDAELLAIILRTGTKGKSAVQLAQELLNQFGDLRSLLASGLEEVQSIKGLGPAKFAQIAAINAIAQRSLKEELKTKIAINCSSDATKFLLAKMRDYQREVFACLLLNTCNQLICYEELFSGSINSANVYPREVVKLVLRVNAASIILAHNHPSGNQQPSEADHAITKRLKHALALVEVNVIDHVIIGESAYSMADHGLL